MGDPLRPPPVDVRADDRRRREDRGVVPVTWLDLSSEIAEELAGLGVVDTRGMSKCTATQAGRRHPPDDADRFLSASAEEQEHMRQTMRPKPRAEADAPAARPRPKDVRPRKLEDLRARIVALLARGFSQREAARMVNVSRATIARALRPAKPWGRPCR